MIDIDTHFVKTQMGDPWKKAGPTEEARHLPTKQIMCFRDAHCVPTNKLTDSGAPRSGRHFWASGFHGKGNIIDSKVPLKRAYDSCQEGNPKNFLESHRINMRQHLPLVPTLSDLSKECPVNLGSFYATKTQTSCTFYKGQILQSWHEK